MICLSGSAHHQHALHSHPGATAVPMATGRGRGTAGLEGKQSPSSLGLLLPWASSGTSSPTQLLLLLATLSATLSLLPVFIHSLEGVPGRLSLPQDRQLWQLSPPLVHLNSLSKNWKLFFCWKTNYDAWEKQLPEAVFINSPSEIEKGHRNVNISGISGGENCCNSWSTCQNI